MNGYSKPVGAIVAMLGALLLWAATAQAAWTEPVDLSPSVTEGTEATGDAQVAALPGGGFVYVWNKSNQDGSVSVVSRVSHPDGTLSPINLLAAGSYPGFSQFNPYYPTVATGADGSIRVAWTWQRIYCSPSCDYRYTAETATLDEDGQISGSAQTLDATSPNTYENISAVSVSIASDGSTLLTWIHNDPVDSVYSVKGAMAEPGQPAGTPFEVRTTDDSSLGIPEAAAAAGGGGFVAYPNDDGLDGTMVNDEGDTDSSRLDPGPISVYGFTTMIDANGTGTVVYKRGDGTQEQVFMRKLGSDGIAIGAGPAMVSEDDSDRWSNYYSNGAAMAADGTVAVTWTQNLTDGGDYGARTRTIAPDGTLGPINTAAQYPGDAVYYPRVAISPDGGGSILYMRDLGGSQQVLVRALDSNLAPTGTATKLSDSQADSSIDPKGIAYSDNGEATALWGDQYGDQWDYTGLRASIFETAPPEFVSTWIQPKTVQGQGIVVAAEATDRSGPVTYSWDFGDGGSAGTAVARHTFMTPGTYTVKVTATDGAGNHASESKQLEVVATGVAPPPDPVPPNTLIQGKPAKKTKSKTATFKFISSLSGSTFECRLDKAGWSGCKSPKKLKKLKPGKHTFKVRALKGELIDATPASYSWTVKKSKKKAGKNGKGGHK